MANDKQFKVNTKFIATRGVKEYRASISEWIDEGDVVLEIGCEWGTTTVLLAGQCRQVLGTDISSDCIERARHAHPDIQFEVLDAISLLNMYATVLRPKAIVIKSGAVKHFAAHTIAWQPDSKRTG